MADDRKSLGFQSAAGLVRYFEEERSKGPRMDPKFVIYLSILGIILVELLKVWFPIT
ncbi:MAG: preprotein translocase subunit Sec61beta [Thermoplasmata archaeon]